MGKKNFKVMSTVACACGTSIKQSIVDRYLHDNKEGSKAFQCTKCYRIEQAKKQHFMATAREVRMNPRIRSQRRIDKKIPLREMV